ncbi:hypothetical protein BST81_19050 [Leptolyngbya sp. 'hensonii']|uniref:hypothetical protein n=1 Tax=Leptolyngbya sp. 'hensonii' TaxID=1922337 RepID=UPI00094FB4E5|nr:hypothetical protein [Leptolyngbya sp. 'hensonii']OLP16794.1 hypothetical protein BST81_19050 [Leptolyngbya sp. 'hensonii']
MTLTAQESAQLALSFLVEDLEIPAEDQDFFLILSSKQSGVEWSVVEIGIEGLPDKWAIQVYDSGDCDPCYTFVSPMPATEDADLEEFPLSIATVVAAERAGGRI